MLANCARQPNILVACHVVSQTGGLLNEQLMEACLLQSNFLATGHSDFPVRRVHKDALNEASSKPKGRCVHCMNEVCSSPRKVEPKAR
jgi:hypothetical protein